MFLGARGSRVIDELHFLTLLVMVWTAVQDQQLTHYLVGSSTAADSAQACGPKALYGKTPAAAGG